MTTTVTCPTCAKKAVWDKSNPYRPFCSQRCKLADLNDWFTEEHRISDDRKPFETENIDNQD